MWNVHFRRLVKKKKLNIRWSAGVVEFKTLYTSLHYSSVLNLAHFIAFPTTGRLCRTREKVVVMVDRERRDSKHKRNERELLVRSKRVGTEGIGLVSTVPTASLKSLRIAPPPLLPLPNARLKLQLLSHLSS